MPFPLPPETWDPNDEYGRAQINEYMASMYHALQRERERINLIEENAGTIRPGPFVGHPGQPVLGTCADDIGEGGVAILAVLSTQVRDSLSAFAGPITNIVWKIEDQDDDGLITVPSPNCVVTIGGNFTLNGVFSFSAATWGVPTTVDVALTMLVNGFQVGQVVQKVVAGINQLDLVAIVAVLGIGDIITMAFSHNHVSNISGGSQLNVDRTEGAAPGEPNSYCMDVNFSGIPGHIQLPRGSFPLLAYTLLEHWGRWQDTGNGDLYLALFSEGNEGDPGFMDLVFSVPIPRGFRGWATNAMVLRYRLGFSGLVGATEIAVTLVVTDTKNGKETTPVPNLSSRTHTEAGNVIDVPYGAELTVTKDQLAELAGFREGTAIRLRFRVALPGVHGSGVVGMGHLELNFA